MEIFAIRLRDLISKKGLMQAELAEDLCCTRTQINNWCVNRASPKYEELLQLAQYFDVSTDYLLGNSNAIASEGSATEKVLTKQELHVLSLYNAVNDDIKEHIISLLEVIVINDKKKERNPAGKRT